MLFNVTEYVDGAVQMSDGCQSSREKLAPHAYLSFQGTSAHRRKPAIEAYHLGLTFTVERTVQ